MTDCSINNFWMTTGCAIGYSILFLIVLFGIGLVVGMCWIERSFICSRCFPSRVNNESGTVGSSNNESFPSISTSSDSISIV